MIYRTYARNADLCLCSADQWISIPSVQCKQRLLTQTKTSVLAHHSCALLRSSYAAEFRFSSRQLFRLTVSKTIICIIYQNIRKWMWNMNDKILKHSIGVKLGLKAEWLPHNRPKAADTNLMAMKRFQTAWTCSNFVFSMERRFLKNERQINKHFTKE